MRKFALLIILFLANFSIAQDLDLKKHCQTLCSPAFHGRGYVNKGDSIAAAYIADQFEQLGLKKYNKSYFQPFHLDVNTFPNAMEISTTKGTLKPGVDYMVDPASAGAQLSLQPKLLSWEVAFDEEKLLEALKNVAAGEKYNAIAVDMTTVPHDSIRKKLRGFTKELAAMVPTFEITDQKFTYSVDDIQLNYPLVYLKPKLWEENTSIDINIDAKLIKNYEARNVIAYMKGKRTKGRTIVYTAHYDHLGRMGKDIYFPGANDNASGTSMLLSMAKRFSKEKPRYNVVFIAFAGEEAGLVGSRHYVEHPLFPLQNISFLLNLDIMGSGEDGIMVVNATAHDREYQLLRTINRENDLLKEVKSRPNAPNSDHYWFAKNNVPCFFIYTMGPNSHYHDVFDTYEELSFAETADITKLLISFGIRFFDPVCKTPE